MVQKTTLKHYTNLATKKMNQILVNQQQLFQEIVQDIQQNKIAIAAKKLRQQEADNCEIPAQWLLKTAAALETDDWSILSEDFINLNFIDKNGYFLMIAPYSINRQGKQQVTLSAIYGKIHKNSEPSIEQLESLIREKFGSLGQPIPRNLSFTEIASCGTVSGEKGAG